MPVRVHSRRLTLLAACGALALAGCETVEEEVTEVVGNNFEAVLSGANAVPGPGDADGWGKARVSIDDSTNRICTDLEVRDVGDVTGAHIHRGAAGVSGPPVIELDPPDNDDSDDCDDASDLLVDEIRNNPAGFYVNVHTAAHPESAIRGQLVDIEE